MIMTFVGSGPFQWRTSLQATGNSSLWVGPCSMDTCLFLCSVWVPPGGGGRESQSDVLLYSGSVSKFMFSCLLLEAGCKKNSFTKKNTTKPFPLGFETVDKKHNFETDPWGGFPAPCPCCNLCGLSPFKSEFEFIQDNDESVV